jgi:hypothetical protein
MLPLPKQRTNVSMQLPRKKRGKRILSGPKTPNDKVGKGLRHFSMKVCEKVQQKGITSYNEVSDFMRLFHVFHIFLHTSFRMSSFLCSCMYKASLKISGRSRTLSGNGHYPVRKGNCPAQLVYCRTVCPVAY